MSRGPVWGGVEAGGTKVVCAVGSGRTTCTPRGHRDHHTARDHRRVVDFFGGQHERGERIQALGVASFGPLDLSPPSPGYGRITTTTKPSWAGTDLLGQLSDNCMCRSRSTPTSTGPRSPNTGHLDPAWPGCGRRSN